MKRFIKDIKKYKNYAIYAAKSGLKAEVANSYLNWLWWILDPLLFMFVYMFIGLIVYKSKEDCYTLFVFTGLTLWNFFNKTVIGSVKLVRSKKSVVSKIYLPKYVLVISRMAENFIKMLISFGIIIVMMICYGRGFHFKQLFIIPILINMILITFGVSTIVMHFGVFIEDLYNIMQVVLRVMFYLSGIFYSIPKKIGGKVGHYLLRLNPIAFCVDSVRRLIIDNQPVFLKWLCAWGVVGLLLSVIGIWLIYRYENSYVKAI